MADNRTMAELLQAPTEGYEDAIVILEIAVNNFELKHDLNNLVQNKQFFGHDKEDMHAHIHYFNKITSTMRVPNVPMRMERVYYPVDLRDLLGKKREKMGRIVLAGNTTHTNDQNDVESDDERVELANLKLDVDENKKIQMKLKKANTTLAQELKECKTILAKTSKTLGESNSVRDSCLVALQNTQTEFEKYKAFNDRIIDYDKLEHKLNETLGQLAQKDIEIKEGLKTKAYEISVVKEKQDELIKHILLTKSHYEGLVKQKTKVITDLKLKEEHDIDKILSIEKQLKFLNEFFYKRSQSIQTTHMIAPKVPTYNGRPTFANPRYLKQAQSEIPCLYAFPYEQSTHANRLIPNREETLALERKSRSKLNKDSVRPYDYTTLHSLYENFKPLTQEYEIQLAHANEIRKKIWQKSFVKYKPNIFKNIRFLPVLKSISKSQQAYNVMTNNINHFKEIFDNAWIKHSKDQFHAPTAQDMEILIQTCLMPLALKTQNDSFIFVHEFKQEMHADLKYVESLEKEIDELESDKAEFSNMYDMILQESWNEQASNVFRKEREKYIKIQDLKAQLQDKNIAISELKKLIEKGKGKTMETKFDKLSVVRKPNAQRIPKPSVLGKPAPFQILFREDTFQRQSRFPKLMCQKVYQNQSLHKLYLKQQGKLSKSQTNVSRTHHRSNKLRDKVVPNNSQVKLKNTQVEEHPRISSISNKIKSVTTCNDNLNSRTSNVNAVCATFKKYLVDSDHFACVTTMLNDVNARTKKPNVVPISTRKPKGHANKSITTPHKKKVASKSNNQKPQSYCRMLYEKTSTVRFSNDQFAPILGYGDLVQGNITINRVYYVEGLNYNLFSVGQFCDVDLKKDIMIGLPKLKFIKDQLCSSCELSKAKRSSFKPKAVSSSKGRLNLLHIDLCGPMRVASINGKKYILSKGYRVYNKRTRLIVESIHIYFDEIKEMSETSVANDTSGLVPQRQKASDYDNSNPVPQLQNVSSSAVGSSIRKTTIIKQKKNTYKTMNLPILSVHRYKKLLNLPRTTLCMHTRSKSYPINYNATIPRRSNRRGIPNIVEPEIRTIEEIVPMADRTMKELLQAPTEGYGEAIVIPEILAENFEIKTNLLQNYNPKGERFLIASRFPTPPLASISSEVAELKDLVRALILDKKNQSSAPVSSPTPAPVKYQNLQIQMANLTDMMSKLVSSNIASSLGSGTLPSNTITNPKEELKGITTRSGVPYQGPIIPTPSKQGTEVTKDQVQTPSSQSTAPVQPLAVQPETQTSIFKLVVAPVSALMPDMKYSIPYPSRRDNERRRDQANEQIEKFYKIFKDMSFEISFTDALILMPKFASTLKALIGNKEKLSEMARTPMNEHCSAVILNKLPRKLEDPSKFFIPCEFPGMDEFLALADLCARINLMPLFVWEALSLPELTPTCMTLELVDRSVSKPIGIAKYVSFKVGVFHFPADFVVVEFEPDPRVPLILERCFLKTGRALIDVHKGELTLRIGNETITYNLDQTVRYSANYNQMTANKIDLIEMACEEYSQEILGFSDVTTSGNPTPYDDPIVSTTSLTLTPFRDIDFLLFEEADAFLGLEDDPNSPKINPFYYDPEGDILLLEAILNSKPLPPPNHEQYLRLFKKELKVCEAKTVKSSVDEHHEVELKDLPPHLEYAFLEGDNKLPVIIAKELGDEEKSALIKVLKSHKRAIAWKLSNIQGINPEFCTHKILIEEDYKPES
nr:reverse transcriptase domain-containing protein [Tanacetum cinerariifolium]